MTASKAASNADPPGPTVIAGAGVVCFRGADEVLLIQRGKPPRYLEWSIPGGRIELGETAREAALRELHEETGVDADLIGLIDVVDAISHRPDGGVAHHYVLVDFLARWRSGAPAPGDDALAARFAPMDDALSMVAAADTRTVLKKAHAMARDA